MKKWDELKSFAKSGKHKSIGEAYCTKDVTDRKKYAEGLDKSEGNEKWYSTRVTIRKKKIIELLEKSQIYIYIYNCLNSIQKVKKSLLSFRNNKAAVGLDGISYNILNQVSEQWRHILLHSFLQKRWETGLIPSVWKSSIKMPILKHGKSRTEINSYWPVALTSYVKIKPMEKIILSKISYFCEKNNVIPVNQAGFRKGRSKIDHLVKFTTHIKKQFSQRKSILATLFDVKNNQTKQHITRYGTLDSCTN